ncbi:hypothetical protein N9954_06180 [Maribacter sp.]|nr:hypothetical protein [Maribacter sp.]
MRQIKQPFLVTAFILFNALWCLAQSGMQIDERTAAYLEKFRADYIQSMLDKNPEIISSYYSEAIRLMPEFQKTILKKENAILYHNAFFKRFDIAEYSREKMEIFNLGARIVEHGRFTLKMVSQQTKQEYLLNGKYQNIWESLGDNSLQLLTEAWNYDHSVDFADQLRFNTIPSVCMALQPHLPIHSNISFELAGLNALMELTIMEKDEKIWALFYADDGMSLHSFKPLVKGRKALDEYFEMHVDELPIFEKLDVRTDQIDELDGYVIEYATAIANWRNDDYSGISTSKNIRIWRRAPNGTLKIFRLIAMYD